MFPPAVHPVQAPRLTLRSGSCSMQHPARTPTSSPIRKLRRHCCWTQCLSRYAPQWPAQSCRMLLWAFGPSTCGQTFLSGQHPVLVESARKIYFVIDAHGVVLPCMEVLIANLAAERFGGQQSLQQFSCLKRCMRSHTICCNVTSQLSSTSTLTRVVSTAGCSSGAASSLVSTRHDAMACLLQIQQSQDILCCCILVLLAAG